MVEDEITTIQLKKSVVKALKEIKKHPRETYNEIIVGLIAAAHEKKEFDLFMQKVQECKMKELWEEGGYNRWQQA